MKTETIQRDTEPAIVTVQWCLASSRPMSNSGGFSARLIWPTFTEIGPGSMSPTPPGKMRLDAQVGATNVASLRIGRIVLAVVSPANRVLASCCRNDPDGLS